MASRKNADGFTLIEIVVVAALIAMIMAALVTRVGGGFGVNLRNSSRRLAAELEYAGQRAVATGRAHRWLVDLDQQTFRLEELYEPDPDAAPAELPAHPELLDLSAPISSGAFAPISSRYGDWHYLDDADIGIDEVLIAGESITDGEAAIGFSPDGGADPADVRLLDSGGFEMFVRVMAFTGEIYLQDAIE